MNKYILRLLSFAVVLLLTIVLPLSTVRASAANYTLVPLEIVPTCSDVTTGLAHWKVTNKNAQAVGFDWTNLSNNTMGAYSAVQGESELLTNYNATDPNNTTRFVKQDNTAPSQTNAQNAPCKMPVPAEPVCVDGHDQQNLDVRFVNKSTVLITTKNNAVLCEDEDIYLSSYVMPTAYNGQAFEGNPTAYPQTIFSSSHTVVAKNQPVAATLTIELPDSCNNIQIDAYYAPEIRTVGMNGHGTQNILSDIYPSTGTCSTGSETGGIGGTNGPTTAPTPPAAPVTIAPAGGKGSGPAVSETPATRAPLPKVLPNTGVNILPMLIILPLLTTIASYALALGYQSKRTNFTITQ